MKTHSEFGASSAKRLIECPGSFRLTRELASRGELIDKPSVYAVQGTIAHQIGEELLAHRGDQAGQYQVIKHFLDKPLVVDGHAVTPDDEFMDHVQTYVKYIETLEAFDYALQFETRVSPTLPWDVRGEKPPIALYGWSDCFGVHRQNHAISVVDLKFGSGVKVDVFENPQLLYYALGVISYLAKARPPVGSTPVELVVIQPRVTGGHEPKLFNTRVRDILVWGEQVLKPAVERVLKPNARLDAGDWCKWCPAFHACPELDRLGKAKVKALFDDGLFEDDAQNALQALPRRALADDLLLAAVLEPWIAALREEALRRMEGGEPVPWHKLVQKRAVRKWTDPKAAVSAASAHGYDIVSHEPLSPAQAEKVAPDLDFSDWYVKQSSGNTVAHESDPRPAVVHQKAQSTLLEDLKGSLK